MRTALLALAGAAVVISAAPANARRHGHAMACRHGHCMAAYRGRPAMMRHARYRTGYVFGPGYGYTAYGALPRPYRTRYHLGRDYRYVYNNGYIYVVDPQTYAVQRVIYALTR